MLNPIENIWSEIKAHTKRTLSSQMSEILVYRGDGGVSVAEYRLQKLESKVRESFGMVSRVNILSYISGVQTIYPQVMN